MTSKQLSAFRISTQHHPLPKLFQLLLLSTVILIIGGGIALLYDVQHETQTGHALGDVSVVGPPTLSASTIDAIFARVGSPMLGTGKVVEQASRQTNIDDAFAMGVWWSETNDGAAGVGLADRNPGSVRGSVGYPSAYDGYTIYPSYTAAILYWFKLLRNGYVNGRGLSTVYTIARPYVGTTNYSLWAGKVIALMWQYRGETPPPRAITSTPQPTPTIDPFILAANKARQRKLTSLQQYLADGSSTSAISPSTIGQTEESIPSLSTATQQANTPSPLSPASKIAIILFGLLTALAIALYALRLKIESLPPAIQHNQITNVPAWDALTPSPEFTPSTEDLPLLPTPVPASATVTSGPLSHNRQTDALHVLPHRIILLPSRRDIRSEGLLSRYNSQE